MIKYLKKIGINARTAFKSLNNYNLKKRNKIINTYNKELGKNLKKILNENNKDLKICKRKDLVDRLILD